MGAIESCCARVSAIRKNFALYPDWRYYNVHDHDDDGRGNLRGNSQNDNDDDHDPHIN